MYFSHINLFFNGSVLLSFGNSVHNEIDYFLK